MGAQLFARLDQLIESVFMDKESTTTSRDKKGCSIEKVIEKLHSIDGVNFGSALHIFATEFFSARSKREMWATMGSTDRKIS